MPLSATLRRGTPLQIHDIGCKAQWNEIVEGLGGHLRQSWEWGELTGRPVHRRVVSAGGEPVAAIAMMELRLPGVPYTVLEAGRGPVLGERPAGLWATLVEAIRDTARRRRAIFVRLSPDVVDADRELGERLAGHGAVAVDAQWTVWNPPRVVMTLDLRGDEVALRRAMRESTRLSLRKAERSGVTFERRDDADAVARFHRLLVGTGRRRGYPVRRLEHFEALRRHFIAGGAGVVILASHGGQDIAGVLGVSFGRATYLLYSAIDPEYRPLRAGVGVHWELIRWARGQGCERMDFGGAVTRYPPSSSDAGYGIYDFKRGLGCTLGFLTPYVDVVQRPLLYRAFRLVESRDGWLAMLRARFNG